MAATNFTPISLYYSTTAAAAPTAGNLVNGELAINITDGKLYYKDNAGVVQVIAGKGGAGVAGGSNTQVQYNSSGNLAGSANMVFDGTTLTANTLTVSTGTTTISRGEVIMSNVGAATSRMFRAYEVGSSGNNGGFSCGVLGSKGSIYGASGGSGLYIVGGTPGIINFGYSTGDTSLYANYNSLGAWTTTGLGIGTNTPTDKLTLNAGNIGFITTGGSTSIINFRNNGNSIIQQITYDDADGSLNIGGANGAYPLKFSTSGLERMRVDPSGNVGVGTSSPTQPVELVRNQDASTWINASNNNAGAGAAAGYLMTNNTGVLGALQLNSSTNSTSGAGNAVVLRTLSTNPLIFGTNSTERMRIDSSGNVGIGTSNPAHKLDVAGVIRNSTSADAAPATQQRITVYNDGSNWGYFGYGVDALMRVVYANTATDAPLLFGQTTAANNTGTFTETLRIAASGGSLVLKGGNGNPGGTGITFPATQNASSNANTLDDYEEGTWSPSIGGTSTYTVQVGKYTKIGNVVTAYFYMILNSKGTGSSFGLTSLPFVGSSVGGQPQFGLMGNFNNVVQNVYWMYYYNDAGTTNLNIGGSTSLTTGAAVPIAQMQNGTAISGSITYFTT